MIEIKSVDGSLIAAILDVKTVLQAVELICRRKTDLTRADLAGADLTRADLAEANLAGADLTKANLAGADLTRANLTRADLAGADMTGADLTGVNLAGANLAGADIDFASWPLWCGSKDAIIDERQSRQLLAHALQLAVANGHVSASTDLVEFANGFHRIVSNEFPKIEFN